jgi:DNA processing protein
MEQGSYSCGDDVLADMSQADERVQRALLSAVVEPGDATISRLVNDVGVLATIERIARPDVEPALHARLYQRLLNADPRRDLHLLSKLNGRVIIPSDADWPSQLSDLGLAAPWLLWVRGVPDVRVAMLRSVAIVGARACTPYGDRVASEFASELAGLGWCIVSGGAFGIDTAAHRGALAAGGRTAAVLACGVDVSYPPRNESLFEQIAEQGFLISEVAPGAVPHRGRFLVRNRVIAALTRGTVVVEAAVRSGSLSTARAAQELNRMVLAVPGPITSAQSAGVNQLSRNGAHVVTSAAEIVEAVGELGADLAPAPRGQLGLLDHLDASSRAVLDALPARGSMSAGEIARQAALAPAEVMGHLALLEMEGLVRRRDTGWSLVRGALLRGAPH